MNNDVIDRSREAAALDAVRHPKKAVMRLHRLRAKDIDHARGQGHETEARRLEAICEGIEQGLKGTHCIDCGAALEDESQPGFEESIGPECYRKRMRRRD